MAKAKILIADDDADLFDVLEPRLASRGYATVTAGDGDEAVALFGREKPDLVLMDVRMPKVDGVLALREMLESDPRARIIIMTGTLTPVQRVMLEREGAFAVVTKPLDLRALDVLLAKALARQPA